MRVQSHAHRLYSNCCIVLALRALKNCGLFYYIARSVTKMEETCDKKLDRLISYMHHAAKYKQYFHGGSKASECKFGKFQDYSIEGNLAYFKSASVFMLRSRSSTICSDVMSKTHGFFYQRFYNIHPNSRHSAQHQR